MAIYKLKQTSFADNAFESAQNIIPAANVVHNLGSPEFQWKELYLSGNTINLGGAQLKTNPTSGAITFIPAPTEENPSPKATVVSATGTIATVDTTEGSIDENDVANVAANVSSVFTDIEATGNITANVFIGDGGLLSNITGVTAETVTGVLTAGDQIVIDSNGLITANVVTSTAVPLPHPFLLAGM